MKAHEIIHELLSSNIAIKARVGGKIFHMAVPQKVKLPAIVFKLTRTPLRTKEGIYAFRMGVQVFGMEEKGITITDFEQEIAMALEGKIVLGVNMTPIEYRDSKVEIDDDFNNYYALCNFEFELNI